MLIGWRPVSLARAVAQNPELILLLVMHVMVLAKCNIKGRHLLDNLLKQKLVTNVMVKEKLYFITVIRVR
jgi:hypothetical protein